MDYPNPLNSGSQLSDGVGVDPRGAVQYQRTREMTLDELMLENRVVFLVGDINQATAARVKIQILYLEDKKRGQDKNINKKTPRG